VALIEVLLVVVREAMVSLFFYLITFFFFLFFLFAPFSFLLVHYEGALSLEGSARTTSLQFNLSTTRYLV
jgi:hypothetical protein